MNFISRFDKFLLMCLWITITACGEYTPDESISAANNRISSSSTAGPCNSSAIYDGGYIRCNPSDPNYRIYLKQAVETSNMTVEMGPGTFNLSDDVWGPNNGVTVAGAGFTATTIERTSDRGDPMIKMVDRTGITLKDFTLNMNNKTGVPVYSSNTNNLLVQRMQVKNANADGFEIRDGRNVTFQSAWVHGARGHGISFSSDGSPSEFGVEDFLIVGSYIRNAQRGGINCANCAGTSWSNRSEIKNNTITYDGDHPTSYAGIRLSNAARYVDVKDNSISNITRGIFVVSKSRWNNIYKNYIYGGPSNDQEGVVIQGPYNSVFCNMIFDMDRAALQIYGNTGVTSEDGPTHNNEAVFRHNLAINQGHGAGNHPGHGVWISHSGNSTGHSTAYNSYNWDDYHISNNWFCNSYPFEESQVFVNSIRATPTSASW